MSVFKLYKPVYQALLTAGLLVAIAPAQAGLFDDDEARKAILDLRSRIDNSAKEDASRMDSIQQSNSRAQLETAAQLELLREEIKRLRGQNEQLANDLANLQKGVKDSYTELNDRIKRVEPQKVSVDGQEGTVEPGEQKAFDAALSLFRSSDFKGSLAALTSFSARYPQSVYIPAAQYWSGNAYYALKDYKSALSTQLNFAKNYPDHPKAPDGLLTAATIQIEQGDKKNARRVLDLIIERYSQSPAAQTAREKIPLTK